MKRYEYIFYRNYQRFTRKFYFFENALHNYVFDFNHCVAYGIGIYDQEANILHLPSYFDKEQQKWAIEEVRKLGYEVRSTQIFEF